MRYFHHVLAVSILLMSAGLLSAADLTPPPDNNYTVVEETVVSGEFKGCNPQVSIPMNGKVFICTTFGYSPALYYPKAIIFKNQKGEYKVLINGNEYKGYFFKEGNES